MNKGLEVMEAYWLFALPLSKIEAVIHPQSIIHSMVTFVDGSTKAQLGVPDMKVPIQYALTFPERWAFDAPRINWAEAQNWTFQPIDHVKFPCFGLAMDALVAGGYAPAVLNASNEIAVERFLNREIPYIAVSEIVRKSLEKITNGAPLSAASIIETDLETRKFAKTLNL
jgi:1-deoxy-D-xylulose-5-phosphate reductoisomerase